MSKDKFPGQDEFFRKFEQLMNDDRMREAIKKEASKYSGLAPIRPVSPTGPGEEDVLEAIADFKKGKWKPITKGMAFFRREERGIYTDEGTPGLFYFKATHWRYIK